MEFSSTQTSAKSDLGLKMKMNGISLAARIRSIRLEHEQIVQLLQAFGRQLGEIRSYTSATHQQLA